MRTGTAVLLSACAASLALAPVAAQKAHDGALDPSIDTESADTGTRLKVVEQEVYSLEEYVYLLLFNQSYGDHVTAERLMIPSAGSIEPAYVFSPKELRKGARYPGLVMVHGSYHGSLDPSQFPLIDAAVRAGYIVIFPEYRGSRGYGQQVWDAIDFGGKEVDDVVAAADYLATTRPVPRDRIGIFGRSKGGMITLLAIERFPDRFAAAVDVVGLADMVAYMAYKPGFRGQAIARQPRFGGKSIAQDAGPYIDVSPLNHVDAIRTPLLIQATTGDKTAPIELHSGRLIDLLKLRGKTFESKVYDDAPGGHIFSEVDSPDSRDSQARIFAFLARYLRPQPQD